MQRRPWSAAGGVVGERTRGAPKNDHATAAGPPLCWCLCLCLCAVVPQFQAHTDAAKAHKHKHRHKGPSWRPLVSPVDAPPLTPLASMLTNNKRGDGCLLHPSVRCGGTAGFGTSDPRGEACPEQREPGPVSRERVFFRYRARPGRGSGPIAIHDGGVAYPRSVEFASTARSASVRFA
jgi:hypothetical protein